MSSASMFATSTSSGHTEVSSSDRRIAPVDSTLHPRPRLARLKSDGATNSAGYCTSTNSQHDRVCAPHAVLIFVRPFSYREGSKLLVPLRSVENPLRREDARPRECSCMFPEWLLPFELRLFAQGSMRGSRLTAKAINSGLGGRSRTVAGS